MAINTHGSRRELISYARAGLMSQHFGCGYAVSRAANRGCSRLFSRLFPMRESSVAARKSRLKGGCRQDCLAPQLLQRWENYSALGCHPSLHFGSHSAFSNRTMSLEGGAKLRLRASFLKSVRHMKSGLWKSGKACFWAFHFSMARRGGGPPFPPPFSRRPLLPDFGEQLLLRFLHSRRRHCVALRSGPFLQVGLRRAWL